MKLIVFEGLNGAGKSTLAKALALELKGRYISSPHQDIAPLRDIFDEASLPAHFFYYMLGNILISEEIKKDKSAEIIICDRYVDSTLARHTVLGLDVKNFDLKPFDLPEPDIKFFIYCNEAERKARIEQRGKKNKWDKLDEDNQLRQKYIDYFIAKENYIFFETNRTEKQSLDGVISILAANGII